MSNFRENREADEFRNSLRGHNKDEGYAERYQETLEGRRFLTRDFVEAGLGLMALFVLFLGFITGFLLEAIVFAFALGFVALIIWGWRKMVGIRRQEQMYNDAVNRQEHGIDVRFGRTGADRKKK